MDDNYFCLLMPGSHGARKKGCSCEMSALTQFRADPACSIHGVAAFKRLLRSPEGRAEIERFRERIIGTGGAMDVPDWPHVASRPGHQAAAPE
jgi:hypothetical protein